MNTPSKKQELRALVVDDEAITRGMVVYALLNEGFVCDVATDGEKAKILLQDGQYDLLVTDLQMPYMNGYALAIDVLGGRQPPRVIVHTAHEDPRSVKELIVRGVDDVIPKPTDYAVFAAKARAIVARCKIDPRQPAGDDSPTSQAQIDMETQESEESFKSPEEHGDRDEAPAVNEMSSRESAVPRDVVKPGPNSRVSDNSVATSPKTSARSAKVFKISQRPSTDTSGQGTAPKARPEANRKVAGKQKLGITVTALMMTVVAAVLIKTISEVPADISSPLPTASPISSWNGIATNSANGAALPIGRFPTGLQRLRTNAWGMVSERFGTLCDGPTRLAKLASDLLPQQHSEVASSVDSGNPLSASQSSRFQVWTKMGGQALAAVSSALEDLSTYQPEAGTANEEARHSQSVQLQNGKPSSSKMKSSPLPPDKGETGLIKVWDIVGDSNASPVDQPAVDAAQFDIQFQRDLPQIQKQLAPLLAHGYSQPVPGGYVTTVRKGPMSLRALTRLGALAESEEGLHNLAWAMTHANDREPTESVPFSGDTLTEEQRRYLVSARHLLVRYQSLLVKNGMLAE